MTNKHISKEIAPPAKTLPIQPSDETFFDETTLFHLEGVPFSDDLYEDMELDHNAFNRLSTLLKPDTPLGVALQRNAIYSTIASKGCLNRLANSLDRIGYSASVQSSAATASTKKGSFYNLRHEYIGINLDGKEYIVDPSFKDHFVVQNPTKRYAAVLALVPETVVVASRPQLLRAVTFLATELERCFEARKVALPPWRKLKSLLSKWEAVTQVARTHRVEEAPFAAVQKSTSIKAALGNHQFVHHSLSPQEASTSPQSVLENQGFLTSDSAPRAPRKIVGFHIASVGNECFCCGLRIRMLRNSTNQSLKSLSFSASAA